MQRQTEERRESKAFANAMLMTANRRSMSVTHPPSHQSTARGRREYNRKRTSAPLPPIIDPRDTVKGGLFDKKRYGTDCRTMQAVPAAAGPANFVPSDVLPDGRRIRM